MVLSDMAGKKLGPITSGLIGPLGQFLPCRHLNWTKNIAADTRGQWALGPRVDH